MGNKGQSRPALALLLLALTGCAHHPVLSPTGQAAFETSVAAVGDVAVAGWYGAAASEGNAIWAQPLDTSATAVGRPLQLTSGASDAFEPELQILEGEIIVAWYEKDRAGALGAWLGRFSMEGEARWRLALSAPGMNGRNPVVRIHAGALQVAWLQSSATNEVAVWSARVDPQGNYVQPPSRRAAAGVETWNLGAAVDGQGVFHVVYDSDVGTRAKELRLLSLGQQEVTERLLTADDGFDSTYPDLAFRGDVAALTWFDLRDGNAEIYLFTGTGVPEARVDREARRVTDTPGVSSGAYLAWNDQRLRLVWCDDSSGQNEIYSQLFDMHGNARNEAARLTRNPTQSLAPAIRAWRGGFLLAWNEYQPPDPVDGPGATVSRAVLHALQ